MTLDEVKQVSVDILKEVDTFCRSKNLHYTAGGGTLIGAIRHKGFIPWDDDIDIFMPRPDYDRFIQSYCGKTTKCFAYELGNSFLTYARVCDIERTYVDIYTPWTIGPTGLWIDVFPIDGINDSYETLLFKKADITKTFKLLFHARGALRHIDLKKDAIWNLKTLGKKILYSYYSPKKLIEKYWSYFNRINFDEATYCGQYAFPVYYSKEYYKTEVFNEYIDVDFCGIQIKAVKEYDVLLRNYFGDYMQLPPLDKRVPSHNENLMYWR